MASEGPRLRSWLFGRSCSVAGQFLVAVGGLYLALVLSSHWVGSVRLPLAYGDSQYALAVVAVGVSTMHGYLNDGLLTSIALAYVLLVGAIAAGMVPVGFPGSGSDYDSMVYLLLVLPLAFATVLGTTGTLLGVASRWLATHNASQSTT